MAFEGRAGEPWFAVRVRSNFERKAAGLLGSRLGCPVFYPAYSVRSVRRGVQRLVTRPLFPGYLFLCDDMHEPGTRREVLQIAGVVGIVGVRGRPTVIEAGVIESLRILGTRPDQVRPHPFLREGMQVVVRAGPFAGARGLIVRSRGRKPRLVISIDILGRSVGVPVDPHDVEPDSR